MIRYTVDELKDKKFGKTDHPSVFHDGVCDIEVDSWAELCKVFVRWLLQNNYLRANSVPIHNHAELGKYFINSTPQKNGNWHAVGQFHVDTKYNAQDHIKNILFTLEQLKVAKRDLSISFN